MTLEMWHEQFTITADDVRRRGRRPPYYMKLTNGAGRVLTTATVELVSKSEGEFAMEAESLVDDDELRSNYREIFSLPLTVTLIDADGRDFTMTFGGKTH